MSYTDSPRLAGQGKPEFNPTFNPLTIDGYYPIWDNTHMKAVRLHFSKKQLPSGNIVAMVIWRIPPTTERKHGLKYRLHHGSPEGLCYVRYDNEYGKGDHKHVGDQEEPYSFETVEKLIADFLKDVAVHEKGQRK